MGYSPLLARLLAQRGVSAETVADWFAPSLKNLAKPDAWPVLVRIAAKILHFVREGMTIVVFGDYDCDGISATAILVKTLSALPGARVRPFIPARLTEGYGMREESVRRMRHENPDVALVVTVDNGISSAAEVASLKAAGIEVIITDHHLAGAELPDCLIADPMAEIPNESCPECFRGLCGAGVAFLVAHALVIQARAAGLLSATQSFAGEALVLAGLATVADVMPLTGQNRILVAEALRVFMKYSPIGLRELLERAAKNTLVAMNAKDFGFLIGPRINAAGRLGDGMDALRLILCTDREEARKCAFEIDTLNTRRKLTEKGMITAAQKQIHLGAAAQVIDLPEGHPGVSGIVAARILESLEETPVPVCVIVKGRGSARAPAGYNLRDALEACSAHLTHFGGHAAAGGFSLVSDDVEPFRDAFTAACAEQATRNLDAALGDVFADALVTSEDLTLDFAEQVAKMNPFGEGNPEPVFWARHLFIKEARTLGVTSQHLALTFTEESMPRAVWWGHGYLVPTLRQKKKLPHEALFTLETSTYGGDHVELRLVSMRPEIPM